MVDRINGAPGQGVFFSKDVRFVSVACTNANDGFLDELVDSPSGLGVNGDLEAVLEIIAQYGTIIGLTVTGTGACAVMVDYGQQFDDAAVQTAVDTAIEAIAGLSANTLTVESGFAPAALGTPT